MKTTFRNLFIALTIIYGGFSFTSCQNDTPSEDVTESRTVSRPKKSGSTNLINSGSDLYDEVNLADIPQIEDDFSDLIGQIHNDGVEYILNRMDDLGYTIFTYTEGQRDTLLSDLKEEYLTYISDYYGVDLDGIENFPPVSESELQAFLSDSISYEMQTYLQMVKTICFYGNMEDLSDMYILTENLTDDRERLILKCYVSGLQYSYSFWSSSSYTAFSFLPTNIMDEYTNPLDPALFSHTPGCINWRDVGYADAKGIMGDLIVKMIIAACSSTVTMGLTWGALAIDIAASAVATSTIALLFACEESTVDAMNYHHSYFHENNNCIFDYMEDKYNTYGSNFFEDHWDGRFLFMVNYF